MLVHDYLEHHATHHPDAVCAEDDVTTWTYSDVLRASSSAGAALRAAGLEPGARFSLLSENRLEWVPAYYGAFRIDAVPVPLSFRLHPREMAHVLDDAGVDVVCVEDKYLPVLEEAEQVLGRPLVRLDLEGSAFRPGPYAPSLQAHRGSPDDDLYQMYTSGTTGRPKGALVPHRAVDACVQQTRDDLGLRAGAGCLVAMPLFHAGAATTVFSVVATLGRLLVMRGFEAERCVEALDERGVTVSGFAPAMVQSMLAVPGVEQRQFRDLEVLAYGGSPMQEPLLRRAMEVFGCGFVQAFGMTECTSAVTMLTAEDHRLALAGRPELLLSCGRPVLGTQVRVVDELDRELPPGTAGEIVVRGPQVMSGYWNLPEASAEALRGGWMHTGDVGRVDAEGYLYVTDRLHDMIISGGENIYPREVEIALADLPGLSDVAVLGEPDERWGERVKAFVVCPDGSLTAQDVVAWCEQRLARFKVPKSVEFLHELPRNPSGKVLKRVLRERGLVTR